MTMLQWLYRYIFRVRGVFVLAIILLFVLVLLGCGRPGSDGLTQAQREHKASVEAMKAYWGGGSEARKRFDDGQMQQTKKVVKTHDAAGRPIQ